MIKPLAFLLLLDFSGSMDQVVEQQPKIQTLKTQVRGVLESAPPTAPAQLIIFGSNPKQGCGDLKTLRGKSGELAEGIMKQTSGAFGKTPLAKGLGLLAKRAIETETENIITVTDGGDSCGQDPCKALQEIEAVLVKKKKKLNLILVAFDIKQDREKFSCFKNLKLNNISARLVEAGNNAELLEELKQAQIQALGLGDREDKKIQSRLNSAAKSEALQAGAGSGGDGRGGGPEGGRAEHAGGDQSLKSGSDKNTPPKNIAFLEIVGAPVEAAFELKGVEARKWHGAFILQTLPGEHLLKFIDPFGIEMKIALAAEQYLKIPWGQLIGNRNSVVGIQSPVFELDWKPDEGTRKVHGDIKKIKTFAEMDGISGQTELPFGTYEVSISSPDWLSGKLSGKRVKIERGQKLAVDLKTLFADEVQWVENPYFHGMAVLEVTDREGLVQRYLASPGQKFLPIPKGAKARFFDK